MRGVRIAALTASMPLAASVLTLATAASASTAAAGTQKVTYQGYTFQVPAAWPVFNLTANPQTCVEFDRHAIYLGTPGANENCPASGAGQPTGALLVQPAAAQAPVSSAQDPDAQIDSVSDARIQVTASYGSDAAVVQQILASASLPAPVVVAPPDPDVTPATTPAAATPAALPGTNETGLGFDTCTAPSSAAMNAWIKNSSYRSVGIYLGGVDRACAQPNLTASWVSAQAKAGWSFLPIQVGPQAEFGQLTSPASQGVTAAKGAVSEAGKLGIKPGATLYYDMEAFPVSQNARVIAFLSAWTTELHLYQYSSGVYSSSGAGIGAIAGSFRNSADNAPDVIWDALWNGAANTSDSVIPAADWAYRQRVHQYTGGVNQTHGGYTINIDADDLNVLQPYGKSQPAATVDSGGTVRVFIRGTNRAIYTTSLAPGGTWTGYTNLGGIWTADPAVISLPGGKVMAFASENNSDLYVDTLSGGTWSGWVKLGSGVQGVPAVANSGGTIRVFVRSTSGVLDADTLPAGSTTWSGLTSLGGSWADDAAAIAESNGNLQVFAVGNNGSLFVDTLSGTKWSGWVTLGGGTMGVPAVAEDQSNTVRVFVRSDNKGTLYTRSLPLGGSWSGWSGLGGEWRDNPTAFVGGGGDVWLFMTGISPLMFYDMLAPGKSWTGWKNVGGSTTGAPAAVQTSNGVIRVYARAATADNLEEYVSTNWSRDSRGGGLY